MERNTVQRQIILAALKKMDSHPTIDEVYTEVQKGHPAISKTTVYRKLRQLAKDGIIRQVLLPDGLERYDKHSAQHHHFNCIKCEEIFDVETEYLTDINVTIQEKYGFHIDRCDIVFSGICLECKEATNQ